MSKPLGAKSLVIREAIKANPAKGNTELAEAINDSADRLGDKIKVTANDVAAQKQALKKQEGAAPAPASSATPEKKARTKPGRKPGRKPTAKATQPAAQPPAAKRGPVEMIDRLFELADDSGGMGVLKRLVDRLAPVARA